MPTTVDRTMLRSWAEELDAVDARIAPRFARAEVRGRARDDLRGLFSGADRKNGWQVAEVAGNATPYGMQHLLGRAAWDADLRRAYLLQPGATEASFKAALPKLLEEHRQASMTASVMLAREFTATRVRRMF